GGRADVRGAPAAWGGGVPDARGFARGGAGRASRDDGREAAGPPAEAGRTPPVGRRRAGRGHAGLPRVGPRPADARTAQPAADRGAGLTGDGGGAKGDPGSTGLAALPVEPYRPDSPIDADRSGA